MIMRWQLLHYFRDYMEGHPEREPVIPASDVVHGDLDKWHDRFRVTVPYRADPKEIASILVFDMFNILAEYKISDPMEQLKKVGEYLRSPHFLRLPFVRLSSMLYAAIARKAPSMKSPPNRGTTTDVTVIASVLPYCQAMFVDNTMAGYLGEKQLRDEVARFGTRIFSPRSKAAFLAYLDELEATAEERHLRWVKMTYPSKWFTEPFMNVVAYGKSRRGREKDESAP